MNESARLLSDGGLLLHSVNCGDHYAYFSTGRSRQFTFAIHGAAVAALEQRVAFSRNRLRPSDFTAAAERRIASGESNQTLRQDLLENLPRTPDSPGFQHYSADELCTTSVTFVAQAGDSS
ncbi:MAG: hypothetical protein IPM02_27585 [Betaproteobacteria bacterium]|nr:hypothetical protein [Betaproteobacteria bacterium]